MKALIPTLALLVFLSFTLAENICSASCGPIPAQCTPGHVNSPGGLGIGITHVGFAQINKQITDTSGYQDYTCTDSTWVVQGNAYQFTAITGQTYEECVRVWIDFNNDGGFDTTEIIFSDSAIVYTHVGMVTIPVAGSLNTPLRMRVASDYLIYPPVNACLPVQIGNYLDFTIYFNGPDAITEIPETNSIPVFPNPFVSETRLVSSQQWYGYKNYNLKIYDRMGALVREEKFDNAGSFIFRREQLASGIFYFSLIAENEILGSGKFIIE